ncbi:MAG: nitrous oxide reductase accessory protein NosL, partial [Flavisolibacter sp.]
LIAPQYPEGLTMNIWLNKLTGQVEIINGLNHYIGMKHIKPEMFPEFTYLVYVVAFFILLGLVVAITGKRKLLFAYLILTVLGGVAAMVDFYKWGYDYGHNLDPKAAIQVPGLYYQPPLIGHKTLLNFDAYSYPDIGGWVVIACAAIFFLVWGYEWYKSRSGKKIVSRSMKKSIPVAMLMLVVLFSSCKTNPQPFAYGKDICDDCKMTIMDPKFGGEIITKKGRIYKFDDSHCMVHFLKTGSLKEADVAQTLFIDYEHENNFLDVRLSYFVVSDRLKSPMNGNAACFPSAQIAEQKVKEFNGVIKNWDQLYQSL